MTRSEILQTAKPILFNTEMVRAILDGRKTVTRKIVNFPKYWNPQFTGYIADGTVLYGSNNIPAAKSPYKPGDYLYVRETWRMSSVKGENGTYAWNCQYKSDMSEREIQTSDFEKFSAFCERYADKTGWISSIYMSKEAARIFLRVTDVRVERLQEITEDGVCEEGAESLIACPNERTIYYPEGGMESCFNTNVCGKCNYIDKSYPELFGELVWNKTIKPADSDKYGWEANPWVWVIEFEKVEVQG